MELNPEQLKEKLNSNEKFIVDFYGTWCMPCKQLAPILERVNTKLKEDKSEVSIYKFDIDQDMELTKSLSVSVLPTIKFYSNGENIKTFRGLMSDFALLKEIETL